MLVTNNSFHHPFGWSPSLKREALECDLSLSCYQLRKLWFFAIVPMGGSENRSPTIELPVIAQISVIFGLD